MWDGMSFPGWSSKSGILPGSTFYEEILKDGVHLVLVFCCSSGPRIFEEAFFSTMMVIRAWHEVVSVWVGRVARGGERVGRDGVARGGERVGRQKCCCKIIYIFGHIQIFSSS
jgi:hypothetical protein